MTDAPNPHPEQVEARIDVARIIALHGLGTVSGDHHRGPPNTLWAQEEWERRILECVPERVEQQCYELADAILASLANRPAEDGERERLDQRCGFKAGSTLDAPKSPEWLAACERLAERFDHWKMPDRAAQIRAGHPGWLIEQACVEAIVAAMPPQPEGGGRTGDTGGWIVGNGNGTHWRTWGACGSEWTAERDKATRYHRREDAEAVHGCDEDAWRVVPFTEVGA